MDIEKRALLSDHLRDSPVTWHDIAGVIVVLIWLRLRIDHESSRTVKARSGAIYTNRPLCDQRRNYISLHEDLHLYRQLIRDERAQIFHEKGKGNYEA